ncbi:MAG TPA: hypothetical protein VJ873_11070 [bacterium]|nr:hypothetical protein [bacterium]
MSVISYRTKMDRNILEKYAVGKLKYRSVNAFIDHAVQKALREELDADTHAKKIAQDVHDAVLRHLPLKFRPASSREEREMLKELDDLRSGRAKTVRMKRDFHPSLKPSK